MPKPAHCYARTYTLFNAGSGFPQNVTHTQVRPKRTYALSQEKLAAGVLSSICERLAAENRGRRAESELGSKGYSSDRVCAGGLDPNETREARGAVCEAVNKRDPLSRYRRSLGPHRHPFQLSRCLRQSRSWRASDASTRSVGARGRRHEIPVTCRAGCHRMLLARLPGGKGTT